SNGGPCRRPGRSTAVCSDVPNLHGWRMPMNRHLVAGMLGLALAGCAQGRSGMPNRGGAGLGPVGLSSFPSIHDTINRENPQVDPAALRAGVVPNGGQAATTTVCLPDRPGASPSIAAAPPRPSPSAPTVQTSPP